MCNYYQKQAHIPEANTKPKEDKNSCTDCGDRLNLDERDSRKCLTCQQK